jgi:hypothetical protein
MIEGGCPCLIDPPESFVYVAKEAINIVIAFVQGYPDSLRAASCKR